MVLIGSAMLPECVHCCVVVLFAHSVFDMFANVTTPVLPVLCSEASHLRTERPTLTISIKNVVVNSIGTELIS